MAFPTVVGTNVSSSTATDSTPTVNLPAGPIKGNDLLLVLIRSAVAGAIGWPDSDWVEFFDASSDGADDQMAFAWRRAKGDEGSTIDLTSGNGKFAALSWQIRGDDMAITPQLSTVATGTDANPNPTTCTPTGGAKDYLWIWIGGWEGEQNAGVSPPAGAPTNYAFGIGAATGTGGAVTSNCQVASARRTNNAASEDAGPWGIGTSDDWTAYVLAVHPLPATAHPPNPSSFEAMKSGLLVPKRTIFLPI